MMMYDSLTPDERVLLDFYRKCNRTGKDMVLNMAYSGVVVANEQKEKYNTSVLLFQKHEECGGKGLQ